MPNSLPLPSSDPSPGASEAGPDGRDPDQIRQAQQVIATAVSKAHVLSPSKTTIQEIGNELGLDARLIGKCQKRFDALTDGEWEQLFDDRQKMRSDAFGEAHPEWIEFCKLFWTDPFLTDEHGHACNFVRRSEKSSDEMRDPNNRKSQARFRIIWLEDKVETMYDTMVRMGKLAHSGFHMSWPAFLELRPFYVKDARRDTCMCVYHLRWREFADSLLKYRHTLRDQKLSTCS